MRPPAVRSATARSPPRHPREAFVCHAHAGERIVFERVEAGADEHEVRLVREQLRYEYVIEHRGVVLVARTAGQADVHGGAARLLATDLRRCARAGIVRILCTDM